MAWGAAEFTEQIAKLEIMLANESDTKKKLYLTKVLDTTRKLYHDLFVPFSRSTITAKQKITTILDARLSYQRYYSIVSFFFKDINQYFAFIDKISDNLEEIDPDGRFDFLDTGADFSNEHVLTLTERFYKDFDDELYVYFSETYKDRNENVNFSEIIEEDRKTDGSTWFIDGVRKNYISLNKSNLLSTYQCAVHEYGHAIANLINPQTSYSEREGFFDEVAAIFPELVALYEHYMATHDINGLYYLYTTLITYVNYAEYLCLHSPVLNAWEEHKFKMSGSFFGALKEDYNIDDDFFESLLSTTLEEEGVYVLSYIVSLELFNLYKKDKKAALDLFKKFLTFPAKEDILAFVVENIPLNTHASEEAEWVLQSFHKELKLRRC